jgi:hypothetical protein
MNEYKINKILEESTLLPMERQAIFGKIMDVIQEPDEDGKCQVCEAKILKYNRHLAKVMIFALVKIERGVHMKYAQSHDFTLANNINVSRLPEHIKLTHPERCVLTIMRHHGLVAKVKDDGKIDAGHWLITKKGWSFLRGEAIPEVVTTFRNRVIDHGEEMVTISDVLRGGDYSDTLATLSKELANLPGDLE